MAVESQAVSGTEPDGLITFTGVTKEFAAVEGPFRAVEDVTLTVMRGEIVTLVGPSGCGKSTRVFSRRAAARSPMAGGAFPASTPRPAT